MIVYHSKTKKAIRILQKGENFFDSTFFVLNCLFSPVSLFLSNFARMGICDAFSHGKYCANPPERRLWEDFQKMERKQYKPLVYQMLYFFRSFLMDSQMPISISRFLSRYKLPLTPLLPDYGPFTAGEESLNLFGDLENKTVLEIACGDGRSLLYNAQRGARELWGLDISPRQIDKAKTLLRENRIKAQLLVSPMEINPGIPFHYFDCVYSIYGLGWTMDLSKTIGLISRYLKTNGVFIFS